MTIKIGEELGRHSIEDLVNYLNELLPIEYCALTKVEGGLRYAFKCVLKFENGERFHWSRTYHPEILICPQNWPLIHIDIKAAIETEEIDRDIDRKFNVRKLLIKLEKEWCEGYWIFAAAGILYLMRFDESGNAALTDKGGFDPDYIIMSFPKIPCDGGDW